jgi:putative ABC transport system ATP-binding protein
MIQLENISKIYRTKRGEVKSLDNVNLEVGKGQFVVVRGPSGSGKTTLLLTLGGMLRPSKGNVRVDGREIYQLSGPERAVFRAEHIGFVFQMFHLVPYLSVLDNVLVAAGAGNSRVGRKEAEGLLDRFGLIDRLYHHPAELSAGERQRTALARALLRNPSLLLADEPTGNLDPDNANEVIRYMEEFHKAGGTVIVVTHGHVADPHADRILQLRGGGVDSAE